MATWKMSERPIECSHCKKPIKVIYKEIHGHNISCTHMCADCPLLAKKLQGAAVSQEKRALLHCASCGTSEEEVMMGGPVGCSECYSVFGDLIVKELMEEELLAGKLQNKLKQPLHAGSSPAQGEELKAPSQLLSLHEALNEALSKENYEQAAYLRDQIKRLGNTKP